MFQFENFDAFLTMAGHGPYVWAAYGLSLTIMVGLALVPLRRQRVLLADVRQRLQAQRQRGQN
ncbi:MAG: heme exporter protein CcmD [Cellvibrionales bacterium]|nr:MAG: heme exporter protein CcmD [Cellvibrionales bacterium]